MWYPHTHRPPSDGAKDEDETNVNTYFICLLVCHHFSCDIFNVLVCRCMTIVCFVVLKLVAAIRHYVAADLTWWLMINQHSSPHVPACFGC